MKIERPAKRKPRQEGGCDWGAERQLLVVQGTKELWWLFACKAWEGRGSYVSTPGELHLADWQNDHGRILRDFPSKNKCLHDSGGRLSKAMLVQHTEAIDEWFGEPGLTTKLSTRHTVILEDEQ